MMTRRDMIKTTLAGAAVVGLASISVARARTMSEAERIRQHFYLLGTTGRGKLYKPRPTD